MKFLVVDREGQMRTALIRLCERNHDVQVIGEAESGEAAIDAARKTSPDVMLLGVELPDMTGFDVLRAIPTETRPLSIMVTTRAEHAVTAFSEGVLDYLVKPVSADRLDKALDRARQRFDRSIARAPPAQDAQGSQRLRDVTEACEARPRFLVGERQHRLYPLDPAKIDYIEADGNYVTIRSGNLEYISRDSIKRLSTELAELGFVRIERSLLLNTRAVLYAEMAGHGAFAFTLTSGACLHSSATYRDVILRVLPLAALSRRRLAH